MTVSRDLEIDNKAKYDNRAIPIIKVGKLMGIVMIQRNRFFKGKSERINPNAAGVPSSADTKAVPKATITLFFKAGQIILFSRALENLHLSSCL